jgi:hypothetical protein
MPPKKKGGKDKKKKKEEAQVEQSGEFNYYMFVLLFFQWML